MVATSFVRIHVEMITPIVPVLVCPVQIYVKNVFQVVKMLILVVVLFLLCWGPRLAKYHQKFVLPFFSDL